MAWRHLAKPQVQKCTRALVKEFAEMEPAEGDRNFRAANGEAIRSAIQEGRFRVADFASVKCLETGVIYRVNGKHTSTVLSEMNGEFPSELSALLERYECDTLKDVANLYATFDPRRSARITGDINKSYAACCHELRGVSVKSVNLSVSGIAYATWENAMFNRLPEHRAQLMIEHSDFVLWINELLAGGDSRHLKRAGVAAAIFKTYGRAKADSGEFWALVRDGSGPNYRSPDRVLNKFLLTNGVRGHASKAKETCHSMFIRSIHAWNAWRKNDKTDLKYYINCKTPAIA